MMFRKTGRGSKGRTFRILKNHKDKKNEPQDG